jgi:SAM-dependent methyltransferase
MTLLDRLLQRWRIRKARPFIAPGSRVLDIGCAGGDLFRLIPEIADGVGLDPDLPASTFPSLQAVFIKGYFPEALPDDQPFDAITVLAVLEHLPQDQQSAFAVACARYLKPGGHLIITVPSPWVDFLLAILRGLWLVHGMALDQHYGYDPRQTTTLFTVPGLELVKATKFQAGLNNLFVFRKTIKHPHPTLAPTLTGARSS